MIKRIIQRKVDSNIDTVLGNHHITRANTRTKQRVIQANFLDLRLKVVF